MGNCAFLFMDERAASRLDHLELSCFMHLLITQLDPHVLQAADVILISRVGLDDMCQTSEISVLEQVPAEGPQGPEVEGPPVAMNQLYPCCRGTQEIKTATQPAFMVTCITGYGEPIK